MNSSNKLTKHIQFLSTMDQFVSSYQELTVLHMRQRRDAVINSRSFTSGLLDVFVDLKQSMKGFLNPYQRFFNQSAENLEQAKSISLDTLRKNDRKVVAFLTFEAKFARSTVREVFNAFANFVQAHADYDIFIAGDTGKWFFEERFGTGRSYKFFPLTEHNMSDQQLLDLGKQLLEYGHITVFNPFFISLIKQESRMTNLTGDIPVVQEELEERLKRRFIYEPGGEQMLSFFEQQIVLAVLKQTVKESLLAILGARITSLEQTRKNLDSETIRYAALHKKITRAVNSRKQRERLAGATLWK